MSEEYYWKDRVCLRYRDCGTRNSNKSYSNGSENGSEGFAVTCHASNKKHISSRIFSYFPRDKEKVFLGKYSRYKAALLKL